MTVWPVQDAKSRFSEFLDKCLSEGPQIVSRRGKEEAVLVPLSHWQAMGGRQTVKDILLGPGPRFELDIPERGLRKRRARQAAD